MVEAADGDGLDGKACLRHQPLLHAVLVADKEKLRVGALLTNIARNCKSGINMSGGTAACQ